MEVLRLDGPIVPLLGNYVVMRPGAVFVIGVVRVAASVSARRTRTGALVGDTATACRGAWPLVPGPNPSVVPST